MNPYRKPFFGDPLFPFELVYHDKKNPAGELPDHLHDRYELVYVHKGCGTFFIDKTFYEKKPGDLFIIPGNTIHRSAPDEANPYVTSAAFFSPAFAKTESLDDSYSPLRSFDSSRKHKSYKLELPEPLQAEFEELLKRMDLELRERRLGYREAVRLQLGELLLRLNRYAATLSPEDSSIDHGVGPAWMKEALRAIDEHPEQDASLAEMSRRSAVTPPHFSRVFKQLTGMNLTDYVNAKRIILAKELLANSDDSVGLIAERCGFNSLPHFHRVFKAFTGMSPAAYKKSSHLS
ncbi:helix-turn-helix domain-containing protein [Cohnella sp. AR92]|uniref:helix-turn-helix domain-containing protein n=1 Tax=Cohnella sp. AR92 TaxID=648716 RepID=UPI000F8DC7E1|nr:helix-turn-helix domain-containing protein [Cohnella sp. AR92]RUS46661.1 AraC family transcriptional regulator [Cohnella sp. AR92]